MNNEALIEKRLNEHPTWREVIDLISEVKAQNEVMESWISEVIVKNATAAESQDRDNLLQDLSTKMGLSIRGRKPVIFQELTTALFKDIS